MTPRCHLPPSSCGLALLPGCGQASSFGTGQPIPTGRAQVDHPVNCVDGYAAKRYREQQGKTLPSEAQWEWTATGGDSRTCPWGNDEPTCEHADYVPGVLPTRNAGP